MNMKNTTGSVSVDAMIPLRIQGNMIPFTWYQTILRPNGKPYLLAIVILSDLVYWFRAVEERDEQTGEFLGWKKRFHADLLQKSYQNYADLLGESKRSVKAAMDTLEEIGVIRREFRDVKKVNVTLNNVMFIDLNVDVLEELTYPKELPETGKETVCAEQQKSDETLSEDTRDLAGGNQLEMDEDLAGNCVTDGTASTTDEENHQPENCKKRSATPPTKFCRRVVQNSAGGSYKISGEAPTEFCGTNTENTTEITAERNIFLSIHQDQRLSGNAKSIDGSDGLDEDIIREKNRELIRENICYNALVQTDNISDRHLYEELYLMICDVVCHKRKTIRIGGEELPWEMVKARFLKLNMQHLQYAAHAVQNTTKQIGNIRAYLLTTLYHAPTTMTAYWSQKANHDLHSGEWKDEINSD